MRILILEPFMAGSHASWAKGLQQHSAHEVEILSMPGRHWKWRMHGSAITLAMKYNELSSHFQPDLLIATDMLDLATFKGLCPDSGKIPIAVYFHENQLSYPWSPADADVKKGRDFHYGFMNWTSALAADKVWFNSDYNMGSFYKGVHTMLKAMPDRRHLSAIDEAKDKSSVLSLGMDLEDLYRNVEEKDMSEPVILWNHRWEYDKGPDAFYTLLQRLQQSSIDFKLIVCGESYKRYPDTFDRIKESLHGELIHFGFAKTRTEYSQLLQRANIIPVTNQQEFFGQSVMEALAAGCYPILPDALAYPGHVPDELKEQCLYKNSNELFQKVAYLCTDLPNSTSTTKSIQQIALQYDWKVIISEYDQTFESAIQ